MSSKPIPKAENGASTNSVRTHLISDSQLRQLGKLIPCHLLRSTYESAPPDVILDAAMRHITAIKEEAKASMWVRAFESSAELTRTKEALAVANERIQRLKGHVVRAEYDEGLPEPTCSQCGKCSRQSPCYDCLAAKVGQPQREQPKAEDILANAGVFKGAHGLRCFLEAKEFWSKQDYGTRLYYGPGGLDYLHRDVLRTAVEQLDAYAALQAQTQRCDRG